MQLNGRTSVLYFYFLFFSVAIKASSFYFGIKIKSVELNLVKGELSIAAILVSGTKDTHYYFFF